MCTDTQLIQASGRARAWSGSHRSAALARLLVEEVTAMVDPSATPAALALLAFLVAVLVTAALTPIGGRTWRLCVNVSGLWEEPRPSHAVKR